MNIILFGHLKGGVGKSTILVNIATELQRLGKDVVIVEADPSVHTASNWARDREEAGHQRIQCVQKLGNLRSTLLDLAERYDFVLVDAAGKDSKEMRTAMTAARIIVVPMQPSQADMDSTEDLVTTIEEARDFNPELKAMGVFNRASTNNFSTDVTEGHAYMVAYPEVPMAQTTLHERKSYKTCLEDGRGVVEMKDGKARAEIQLLAQEVLKW